MTQLDHTPASLAQKLTREGFRGTPIVRAIAELVGSYLGASNLDGRLLGQLQGTNSAVGGIIEQPLREEKPVNLDSGVLQNISPAPTEQKAA